MNISPLAILGAAVAAWLFGAAWYGVLGRVWRDALIGRRDADPHAGASAVPIRAMIISFVAELVMAIVLAGLIWHLGGPAVRTGVISAGLVWIGFVVTTLVTNHAYQGERFRLTAIDAGHWLGVLMIQGFVIGAFG